MGELCEKMGQSFKPTGIQEEAMQSIFQGYNIAMQGPTGTGKTLAYLLPLLLRLEIREDASKNRVTPLRLLILVPTADLQMQITGIIHMLVGEGRAQSVVLFRRDVENCGKTARVVVATPRQIKEKLEDPVDGQHWKQALQEVETVVVDEADKLVAKWTLRQK